ncbi:hypothetical protein [Lactobacillus iners]|jgi:hypothetical protein|uniref:hypothetical protein n=1 Tax=Lactobacillus iners TaxID=147802 RepID=UPI0001F12F33|nr:hypothetical protein [Lactobacillus iners]EFU78132.1 hypothetical protein HMPREF9223_0747 [Lactobacillus iners ATCC 55195]MBW8449810.1 hypothetical protein [Lactobacillus iners]MCT7703040.1 hypothetical protein [Lactobacillus iners]MCT7719430.1 hypothetical protein [Lactobacillus iners]MCT7867529.1 hypothetical protein [Lactobacillus iners]
MDVQKIREVIRRRNETHDEYDYGVEMCDKEEIQILSEDIPSTINYLQNQCTADEFFWISEIIDDLAAETQSREIVECYKNLGKKYPDMAKTFNFSGCVKYAEAALVDDANV